MPENTGRSIELLKYPIAIISIVVALWVARWLLGFDITSVSEVTMAGVKFRDAQEATGVALTDLEQRLNQATERIEMLEQQLADVQGIEDGGSISHMTDGTGEWQPTDTSKARAEWEESKTERVMQVSDQVAQVTRVLQKSDESPLKGKRGYIYLGFYEGDSRTLKKPLLVGRTPSDPTPTTLDAFLPGFEFRLRGNTRLIDQLPPNDASYYRNIKTLGAIPSGTLVEILEKAKPIRREKNVECWVKVEVLE